MTRTATCQCGQLTAVCEGEPVRVSVCHCYNCQQRSGSAFATQARFPTEAVTLTGETHSWQRTGDDGTTATFHFCPTCGSGVWYENENMPGVIAIPVGNFTDRDFPYPIYSVYEERMHPWVRIEGAGIDHYG